MKYDLVLGMLDCFDLGVWVRFDFVLGFLFENVAFFSRMGMVQ